MNTIRLWLPQLFAIVEEFFTLNESASGNATLCDMLAMRTGAKAVNGMTMNLDEPCVPVSMGFYFWFNISTECKKCYC